MSGNMQQVTRSSTAPSSEALAMRGPYTLQDTGPQGEAWRVWGRDQELYVQRILHVLFKRSLTFWMPAPETEHASRAWEDV